MLYTIFCAEFDEDSDLRRLEVETSIVNRPLQKNCSLVFIFIKLVCNRSLLFCFIIVSYIREHDGSDHFLDHYYINLLLKKTFV